MKISVPFSEAKSTVDSPGGSVLVRAYQIVIPIRVSFGQTLSQEFPAILDTGHNLNLSVSAEHLKWIGNPQTIGKATVNKKSVELKEGNIVIGGKTLNCPEGIAVHDVRLPTLGLRALVRNGLKLVIDGKRKTATISK